MAYSDEDWFEAPPQIAGPDRTFRRVIALSGVRGITQPRLHRSAAAVNAVLATDRSLFYKRTSFYIQISGSPRCGSDITVAPEVGFDSLGRLGLSGDLLAKGEYFERRVGAAAEIDAGGGKECEDECDTSG